MGERREVESVLVSFINDILVVGKKRPNDSIEIINAFQGEEAKELYTRLVTKNAEVS